MRVAGLTLLLLLGCLQQKAVVAQPLPSNVQPVPQDAIRGQTLTVQQYNFSVTTPAKTWEWLTQPMPHGLKGRTYICSDPTSGAMLTVMVFDEDLRDKDVGPTLQGFISSFQKSLAPSGRRLEKAKYEGSNFPLPGSYRISGELVSKERAAYWQGYLFRSDRMYVFQAASEEATEPEAFTKLVRSFVLLRPPPKPAGRSGQGVRYLFFLLVGLGVGAAVNRLAGRPLINGALVASAVILALLCLHLVATLRRGASAEDLGFVLGEAFLPVVLSLWLAHRFRKKKHPAGAGA